MAKICPSNLLVLVFLFVCFTACNKAEQKTEQKTIQHNIPIKVAIIYSLGGAQAVAREDFYLLNKDAIQIWKQGGLMNDVKIGDSTMSGEKLFKIYFMADRINVIDNKKPSKYFEPLKPHVVKTVTTDFEGDATFESVPEGNYFIYGVTETRGGYAVWSYQVSTNENKTVLLDNKNASYSW